MFEETIVTGPSKNKISSPLRNLVRKSNKVKTCLFEEIIITVSFSSYSLRPRLDIEYQQESSVEWARHAKCEC
jgi:hypothetical protein